MSELYWTSFSQLGSGISAIGRAHLDGTGVNPDFISTGGSSPGLAVGRAHIYWSVGNAIARANHHGTDVDEGFIAGLLAPPWGLAVGTTHIYWGSNAGSGNQIGRANVDGSGVNEKFVTFGSSAGNALGGVAVTDSHIYWTTGGSIGRASIDAADVTESFIPSSGDVYGVAIGRHPGSTEHDRAYIYWTNGNGAIGRARLDGTDVNGEFITPPEPPSWGLAVDGRHVYWTNPTSLSAGTIARARVDGTGVDENFIAGLTEPWSLALHVT